MTLKDQIYQIASRWIGKEYADYFRKNTPKMCVDLAVDCFRTQRSDCLDVRAVRHCLLLVDAMRLREDTPALE